MKVALVYDRVNKWGGAERVLLALHKLFPEAPLYTSVYHKKNAGWADAFAIQTSFLQKIPGVSSRHEIIPFLMPLAFEQFSFDRYDLVISVTSESAKGILTKPHTKHICYCLTPTRYLWSGYQTYFPSRLMQLAAKPTVNALRNWDKAAAHRPDQMIAISEEVSKRIKKYYDRDAMVIYPPTDLGESYNPMKKKTKNKNGDYFLIVSRLSNFTRYKRIDLAIEACSTLKVPLKVIGSGSWKKELQAKAGSSVEFLGSVSDEQLISYYENCRALIFPGVEDFGLTIIEAQRFGKPVIAYRGGGSLETIKEGKTGIFFDKQTKKSLMEAIKAFEKIHFDSREAKRHFQKFSFESFKKKFMGVV
ncbi:MAG: glycosyltransferase [Patescibacteria group bacterium]